MLSFIRAKCVGWRTNGVRILGKVLQVSKGMSFSQNTAWVEIIITSSIENCMTYKSQSFCYSLCELLAPVCFYNFNPCGIFEKMTSFSPILTTGACFMKFK